jgi:hypothetical protein
MSKYFNEKMSTYNKVEQVLAESQRVFAKFVPLNQLVNEFKGSLLLIRNNMQLSVAAKGTLLTNKQEKFELMIKLSVRHARKALVWAKQNKVTDAILVYDVVMSDFKLNGVNSLSLARNVFDRLVIDVLALKDYMVTQADIDALDLAIKDAQTFSSEPATKRKRGAEANRIIKDLIHKTDDLLDNMEDLIVGVYEETDISFVRLFLSARQITDLGSRKTKVLVHVMDKELKPVADAYADVLEMENEEQFSDENGDLTIVGIKNGTYTLVVSKEGIKVTTKFTIQIGEQLKLKVVL